MTSSLTVPPARAVTPPSPTARTRQSLKALLRNVPLQPSDVLGLTRLGFDATVGIVDIVEAMHHTIASRTGIVAAAPAGRTRGITGGVYAAVRGTARGIGQGAAGLLGALLPPPAPMAGTPGREQLLAIVNGVWGDHLVATGNPLAIPPALRVGGVPLVLDPEAAPPVPLRSRVLVLVHGLCMNDLQWNRRGHDHGQALARHAGWNPVYFHYNSGRHVSENGRDLGSLLQRLAHAADPADLAIVGHSMGGLVARSACHHAQAEGQRWLAALSRMVFLGTPHHGAPLERGGRLVDAVFGISPYAAPIGRLGKVRSAGITDLRWGNVQDADWRGRDRHAQHRDDRQSTPLPDGVACYAVAATMSDRAGTARSAWLGDGLVPRASALGEHRNPKLALHLPLDHREVVSGANHWDLLDHPAVAAHLLRWLAQANSVRACISLPAPQPAGPS